MDGLSLPAGLPPVYRGGPSLVATSYDVKLDRRTGLLKTSHGVSIDAEPAYVARLGAPMQFEEFPMD